MEAEVTKLNTIPGKEINHQNTQNNNEIIKKSYLSKINLCRIITLHQKQDI